MQISDHFKFWTKFATQFFWVDGDICQEVSSNDMHKERPHVGWAFLQNGVRQDKVLGRNRKTFFCLGVFVCPQCQFVAWPQIPKPQKIGVHPSVPKDSCPKHPLLALKWIPCRTDPSKPCKMTVDLFADRTILTHKGTHGHPHPPVSKPAPRSLEFIKEIAITNPSVEPTQLHIGTDGRPPLPSLDPALNNVSVIAHYHRNFLKRSTPGSLNGHGVRSTSGALFQMIKELPEGVVKDFHVSKNSCSVTIQTEGQRWVMNNTPCGLESDTVHSIIEDLDMQLEPFDHFTSALDPILGKWVPVLSTVIVDLTKEGLGRHWQVLIDSVDVDNKSWEEFEKKFPGVTLDWSDAEAMSLAECLVKKVMEWLIWNRPCHLWKSVMFLRSVNFCQPQKLLQIWAMKVPLWVNEAQGDCLGYPIC